MPTLLTIPPSHRVDGRTRRAFSDRTPDASRIERRPGSSTRLTDHLRQAGVTPQISIIYLLCPLLELDLAFVSTVKSNSRRDTNSFSLSSLESYVLRRPNLECDHMQKENFEL